VTLAARAATLLPGGVVAVADGDGATALEPFGTVLTVSGRRAAAADDRFLLTSMTKSFTALQVLLLAADGRFDLTTPLAAYVPEFAAAGKDEVTTEHILTHTSGLDPAANTAEGPRAGATAAEHLAVALAAPLITPPGACFAYSSPGFWVLAELVRRLSGRSHAEHLAAALTGPLGLSSETRYEIGVATPDRYALRDAPGAQDHHELARRAGYPAGGLVGTAGDLLLLGHAILGAARPLSGPLVAALRTPRAEGLWQDRRVTWGLGFELGGPGTFRSPSALFCSGASGTAMWVDVEHRRVVVLVSASWATSRRTLAELSNVAFSVEDSPGVSASAAHDPTVASTFGSSTQVDW
jgi:CubicO group peptidase (beta-lactamase class C family)